MSMPWPLVLLNTIMGVGSAAAAGAAVARPRLLAPHGGTERDDRFYPSMYAARSIPLGLMVPAVVCLEPGPLTPLVLIVAALAQLADTAIGLSHRLTGMAVGAAIAAACHIAGALVLL